MGVKRRLAAYRVTTIGWFFALIVIIGVTLALVGSGAFQVAGIVAVVVVLLFVAVGGSPGGVRGVPTKSIDERRAEFGPATHEDLESSTPDAESELWKRERERYKERN